MHADPRPHRHAAPGARRRATPAFVPLATRGAVKTLEPRDVDALGYELILGNTFHLFLAPGPGAGRRARRAARFMRWERPIITDSGGFQVFSMGHGGVADEIKGAGAAARDRRRSGASSGRSSRSTRRASASAPTSTGRERFLGPETSMSVQAALGSDIALVFDECTPFHVSREYTARSMERTHRWLERCLRWHDARGAGRTGRVRDRPGRRRARPAARVGRRRWRAAACDGIAIGGSLGQDKAQMHEVVSWTTAELERLAPDASAAPARDRRRRRPDRRGRARDRHVRLRAADPARAPRRRARPRPGRPLARRPGQGALARDRRSRSSTAVRARPAPPASRAPTCTTCCAPAS